MKRKFALFILYSIATTHIICTNCYGQQNKFNIGTIVGPSLTSVRTMPKNTSIPTWGAIGGMTFSYNFSPKFSLETGLLFEKRKTKINSIESESYSPYLYIKEYNVDYLTIPLLTKINLGKKNIFYTLIGPSYSFLINQTQKKTNYEILNGIMPNQNPYNSKIDEFKKNDFSVNFGAGIHLPLKDNIIFNFEIRKNFGLIDSYKNPNDYGFCTTSNYFLTGITYKLGREN